MRSSSFADYEHTGGGGERLASAVRRVANARRLAAGGSATVAAAAAHALDTPKNGTLVPLFPAPQPKPESGPAQDETDTDTNTKALWSNVSLAVTKGEFSGEKGKKDRLWVRTLLNITARHGTGHKGEDRAKLAEQIVAKDKTYASNVFGALKTLYAEQFEV